MKNLKLVLIATIVSMAFMSFTESPTHQSKFISTKYPGEVDWPDEIYSIMNRIKEKMGIIRAGNTP